MKNSLIDNQGFSLPHEKKTKLEKQIAELKTQEQQIIKELKSWQIKAKKASNLANCLATADKFGSKFLDEAVESENNREPANKYLLKILIRHQVEFNLKFEAGAEVFTKLVLESIESQVKTFHSKLESVQSQIQHQERKFARLQARRQGKTLLDCEYRKGLGCLGE
jgi:hypothetical protein